MKIQLEILAYLKAVKSATLRNIDRSLALEGIECDMRDIKHALQVMEDNGELVERDGVYSLT